MKYRAARLYAKMKTTSLSLAFIRGKHIKAVRDMDKTMSIPKLFHLSIFLNLRL